MIKELIKQYERDNSLHGNPVLRHKMEQVIEDLKKVELAFKAKCNPDIINFRYKLIEKSCASGYNFGKVCNDNHTNIMTPQRKETLEDVLIFFNNHFSLAGYELG